MSKKLKRDFAEEFIKGLSKLEIDFQKTTITSEVSKIRAQIYMEYLESNQLEDNDISLIKFYSTIEIPNESFIEKFVEGNCRNNFKNNASWIVSSTFKNKLKSIKGGTDLSAILFAHLQDLMINLESMRMHLGKIDFYVNDISSQIIAKASLKSHEEISYSFRFDQILLIMFFKGLKAVMRSARTIGLSKFNREFLGHLLFLGFTLTFGVKQASIVYKLRNTLIKFGTGFSFVLSAFEFFSFSQKMEGFVEEKEGNVHLESIIQEVKKSNSFFENINKKISKHLNQYVMKMSEKTNGWESFDQKMILLKVLQGILKGVDEDTNELEEFIKTSEIRMIDLEDGWSEIVIDESCEDKSDHKMKGICDSIIQKE